MEAKWLEDFIALAETRSFSRAAELRHITQPAFSRRIQALEAWVGTDLVDRTVYPTRLTPAGETFRAEAIAMLAKLEETRAMLRGMRPASQAVLDFAVPHTLSLTFFPQWLSRIRAEAGLPRFTARLMALNVHDAAMSLVQGGSDLAMVYYHPSLPVQLDPRHYDVLVLGTEAVYPYARSNPDGTPQYVLGETQPAPYLAYAPNAYLGRIAELILSAAQPRPALDEQYETDMAEGLKAMALEGHGVAFLPESAVTREVASRRLACAGAAYTETMEIRLYRERPPAGGSAKPLVDALWRYLSHSR
ncbi:LysR family transcriptional regulator [Pigmentiphaga sp.]|jgi:Transcriptional regulator|uniref:LysR family transcriptional regulator n=1 Tax=Pigmentiphaga sp. TaxID=1977564 RepID=UPI0025DDC1E4|nr:LysR family transcriptional regulator [Pigmentiphaga sp.]MBX6319435.1 LysR family transcriptional regulator [Pigmentiphaga sp.]